MSNNALRIEYTCKGCNDKKYVLKVDKTGYYENKALEQKELCKCSKCNEIKPIDNYAFVNMKESNRRRKQCNSCRKIVLSELYQKRKNKKLNKEIL